LAAQVQRRSDFEVVREGGDHLFDDVLQRRWRAWIDAFGLGPLAMYGMVIDFFTGSLPMVW
jgi:hypothetical protein